jgi:phosphoribosyl-ATP pyrophosphohydrolase/phosphoribosyl-AMP cyclohydrolase
MLVPSLDLEGGSAVQLVGGVERALDAGDPRPILERFGRVGPVALIDLDAARGVGSNAELVRELLPMARCRVGGGIRSVQQAISWLDAGAEQVILGTAATPELLSQLPRERVVAAVDACEGEVVVDGWRTRTGLRLREQIERLAPHVGGLLVTFVEREGRMEGTALSQVPELVAAAGGVRITFAGGVSSPAEIRALDEGGADAQVGMALYTGRLGLAEAFAAPLRSDRPDGLWPTLVCDEGGLLLGLAWSDEESLAVALDRGVGAYRSRRRGLWIKGEQSGAVQELVRAELDCDRDALRFIVRQHGPGFCHQGTATCFGPHRGLPRLLSTVAQRQQGAPAGSYTARLLADRALLRAKLLEEAGELAEAGTAWEAEHEMADLLYFAAATLLRAGGSWAGVERLLDRRALAVTRRPGDRKEGR